MSSPHPDEHKMLSAMRSACGAAYEAEEAAGGAPIWENDVPHRFRAGPYWQNPDGSPKALCAAPAGPDYDICGREAMAAPLSYEEQLARGLCLPRPPFGGGRGVYYQAARPKALSAASAGSDARDGGHMTAEEAKELREAHVAACEAAAAAAPRRPVLNPEEDESDEESGLGADEVPPRPERIWVHGAWTEWEETPEAEGRSHFPSVKRWRFKHTVKSGYLDRPVIQVEFRGETHTHVLCAEQVKMVTNKLRGAEGDHEVVIDTTKQKGQWNPTYLKFRFQKAENALAFQMSLVDFLSH